MKPSRPNSASLFFGLLFALPPQSSPASDPPSAPVKLAGTWKLNKELSDDPGQKMMEAMRNGNGASGHSGWRGNGRPRWRRNGSPPGRWCWWHGWTGREGRTPGRWWRHGRSWWRPRTGRSGRRGRGWIWRRASARWGGGKRTTPRRRHASAGRRPRFGRTSRTRRTRTARADGPGRVS